MCLQLLLNPCGLCRLYFLGCLSTFTVCASLLHILRTALFQSLELSVPFVHTLCRYIKCAVDVWFLHRLPLPKKIVLNLGNSVILGVCTGSPQKSFLKITYIQTVIYPITVPFKFHSMFLSGTWMWGKGYLSMLTMNTCMLHRSRDMYGQGRLVSRLLHMWGFLDMHGHWICEVILTCLWTCMVMNMFSSAVPHVITCTSTTGQRKIPSRLVNMWHKYYMEMHGHWTIDILSHVRLHVDNGLVLLVCFTCEDVTCTVRKVLADFTLFDWWRYWKALCDVKI